jgi:hypothetical protein
MYGSPTLAFELQTDQDAFDALWARGLLLKAGGNYQSAVADSDIQSLSGLEFGVGTGVARHLNAVCALKHGDPQLALTLSNDAVDRWKELLQDDNVINPRMTPRSHAFHMRLASKHADFYHRVERSSLQQWLVASRLKGEFLGAMAAQAGGDIDEAISLGKRISDEWRQNLSPRLPGLGTVERMSATWSRQTQPEISYELEKRLATLVDRSAPYADDAPDVWTRPRNVEGVLRFGFAATLITWL